MAYADVPFCVGRESADLFDELLAGTIYSRIYGQDKTSISPYMANGALCPSLSRDCPEPRSENRKTQAYCFRLTMTNETENAVPIQKPVDYVPELYECLLRKVLLCSYDSLEAVVGMSPVPNRKIDLNGLNFVGASHEWPWLSHAERAVLFQKHVSFTKGLLWFLCSDHRVPGSIRKDMQKWGYAKDEFIDNGHFPPNLYVRAARRMNGEYTVTEQDVFGMRKVHDGIAVGTYSVDAHVAERVVTTDDVVIEEGSLYIPAPPYPVSYRSLIPKRTSLKNLFVPVALSASYVAYSSIRMEPVFMALGHAAGTAAALCLDQN